jgi:hypothetical protein
LFVFRLRTFFVPGLYLSQRRTEQELVSLLTCSTMLHNIHLRDNIPYQHCTWTVVSSFRSRSCDANL